LSFLIGGGLGLVAAINRRWLDQALSRFVDVLMAIPSLIFALMLLSIFGSTITSLIMIIAVLDSTRVFRLTRSVAVNVAVMDYVEAARLRGEGLGWVMRREILPNIMPPLVAEFGLRFCFVFLTIAALSFLGCRHSAADRGLGLDGARQCLADPVCQIRHDSSHHATAAGGRDRAAHRGGELHR
jgi:peptide/nickel transport system permease protein